MNEQGDGQVAVTAQERPKATLEQITQAERKLGIRNTNADGVEYKDGRNRIGGAMVHTGETFYGIMQSYITELPENVTESGVWTERDLYRLAQGVHELGGRAPSVEEIGEQMERLRVGFDLHKYADIAEEARKLARGCLIGRAEDGESIDKDFKKASMYALIEGHAMNKVRDSAEISDEALAAVFHELEVYRNDVTVALGRFIISVRKHAGYVE